ncbi:PEP-CTERM sorting domain-containing protein [Paludibaculum fermentans]|uniref:PEP-CTERM sorting domain-containing protein n=1 Tax=Paludibaculum fermentans TaxID=1473598 RepID=UPI003EB765C4
MQQKKRVNTPVAFLYFGLMTVLAFMVLVGPSAASAVSANVYVYGSGVYGSGQTQYGNLDFVASEWNVDPFLVSGPTISQSGSQIKMSNLSITCNNEAGCGEITIAAYLSGLTNPGVFTVSLDGTFESQQGFNETAFGDSAALYGSYFAYTYLGNSQVGVFGNLVANYGPFSVGPFTSPDLSAVGSPFNMVFGVSVYGMNYLDTLSMLNSFNINVNTPSSVPEPSSMALFAGGLVGLGLLRRKLYKRE